MSEGIYRVVNEAGEPVTTGWRDARAGYRTLAAARGIKTSLEREDRRRVGWDIESDDVIDESTLPVYRIQVSEVTWKDVE